MARIYWRVAPITTEASRIEETRQTEGNKEESTYGAMRSVLLNFFGFD